MRYVYFTEADQLTAVKDGDVLRSARAILNATNYVAPQRLQMHQSAVKLRAQGFDERSISALLAAAVERGQEAMLSSSSSSSSAVAVAAENFPFTLENECRPGQGEAGWLGKAAVHAPAF